MYSLEFYINLSQVYQVLAFSRVPKGAPFLLDCKGEKPHPKRAVFGRYSGEEVHEKSLCRGEDTRLRRLAVPSDSVAYLDIKRGIEGVQVNAQIWGDGSPIEEIIRGLENPLIALVGRVHPEGEIPVPQVRNMYVGSGAVIERLRELVMKRMPVRAE